MQLNYELLQCKNEILIMRMTISVPDSLEKEIREIASQQKTSMSSFIVKLLSEKIEEKRRKELGHKLLDIKGNDLVAHDALDYLQNMRRKSDRY